MTLFSRPTSRVIRRKMSSTFAVAERFCTDVRSRLSLTGLPGEFFPVEMLLRESLNNAIIHGNDNDPSRSIRADVCIGRKQIIIRVADEGDGFDWKRPPSSAPATDQTHGRGLPIYGLYAAKTIFNDKGNQVTFIREINREINMAPYGFKHEGTSLTVILEGDLTAALIPTLKPELQKKLEDGVTDVVFDLRKTTIMDSTGIGFLIAAYNSLQKKGGSIHVTSVSGDLLKLLQSMRLDQRLGVSGVK